ncbi:MAG: MBL fold metallo-hydrolase, partial [Actinomycetota bacterium]
GAPPHEFTVSFLDVGQGDAILFQDPGGATVLIDGGPGSSVTDRLKESGVDRLDAVILSHPHAAHLAGLEDVVNKYPVAAVYDAASPSSSPLYRDFLKQVQEKGIPYSALRKGRVLSFGELVMSVLSPGDSQKEDDMNANSVVIAARFRGLDILLPGDAEGNVLSVLDLPQVEVFKVGHHGSRDGLLKPVLDSIRPGVAVISCGAGNSYGHPAQDTLAKLKAAGAETYRLDTQGTVRVTLAGGNMEVQTER